jgi:hypothetical protein
MKLTDLIEAAQKFRPQSVSGLNVTHLGPREFKRPASEETLVLHFCSEKNLFGNLATFTFTSVWAFLEATGSNTGMCLPLMREAELRAITSDELDQIAQPLLLGLVHPVDLAIQEPLIHVVQLFDDWNFIAIVGETGDSYFAIYWETTA